MWSGKRSKGASFFEDDVRRWHGDLEAASPIMAEVTIGRSVFAVSRR
jgi:hypothetical protein